MRCRPGGLRIPPVKSLPGASLRKDEVLNGGRKGSDGSSRELNESESPMRYRKITGRV